MKMIEGFEKEHPEYEVEYQEAPWGDDFETKLNTGFASGTAADVIHYSLSFISSYKFFIAFLMTSDFGSSIFSDI